MSRKGWNTERVMTVLLLVLLILGQTGGQDDKQILLGQNPCVSKEICSDCLQTSGCAWCSQPQYRSTDGSPLPRCNLEELLTLPGQCSSEFLVNPNNYYHIQKNDELRRSSADDDAVQVTPQHVSLSLRVGDPYDMDFYYEQAIDYPVDLYYLMDLSKSMEDDKEKLSALGDLLAETMQNLTSNFRLGFGSFVDKVVMPYVSTVPTKLLEPCQGCAAPYGFRHHMNLNTTTSAFAMEVKRAQVSGNLDAPEGGFDAIMQAVVCKKEIGWRDKARRLLIFSTDAGFHYAGDGKLGGIVEPHDGLCHMSDNVYTHSSLLDYPSVAQINRKVKENSVNLIFAVTEEQVKVYTLLADQVEGSSAGQLSDDSSNVVQLVQAQYEAITSSLVMKDTSSGDIKVTYYSSCLGSGPKKQTNSCLGLKVGNRVMFTAKIEVLKCPSDPRDWHQTFSIYPVGINESVTVEVSIQCQCQCEKPGNLGYEASSPLCSGEGDYQCGVCNCHKHFFGRKCECSASNVSLVEEWDAGCRPPNSTEPLCNNRGECICGQCQCFPRDSPDEKVSGQYCQCDNFSCDRFEGEVCSGPSHGECECGVCKCASEWDVAGYTACECSANTNTCLATSGKGVNQICSGHGVCQCGECLCHENEEGQYSGRYCEDCPTCPGRCEELKQCVLCHFTAVREAHGDTDTRDTGQECHTLCPEDILGHRLHTHQGRLTWVEKAEDKVVEDERLCMVEDQAECRISFVYGYNDTTGELLVWVQDTEKCPQVPFIVGIVLAVIGAILALGLGLIFLWKVFTSIHDRREFAKFEAERMMAKWDTGENPIFKQATSTFKNPTYIGK